MAPPFVPIGRVVKTHGLRGEVSVRSLADLPLDRLVGKRVWIAPPTGALGATEVLGVRPGPKGPLLTLDGVSDVATAGTLIGRSLMASSADLPDIEEELDPVGLSVIDEQRGALGTVRDVIVTGANDVWVVQGGPFGEVLIPVIDEVVLEVDEATRVATVRLLPGLLEDER